MFHILTGDTQRDLLEITKLVMEIKMHGRNKKTCYITTAMLFTGLILQKKTSFY